MTTPIVDDALLLPPEGAKSLLSWYKRNKRPLPWRKKKKDPYAVWISEVMLQQTTVNTVISFFERWMLRFPTIQDLAEASLDDVLLLWAGLGYYSRARNVKKTAEIVVNQMGGKLPQTPKELVKLPGIGRYTAGAIASIAFNVDAPILDANVIRVLCRLGAFDGDPKTSAKLQKILWKTAEEIIPSGKASDFNQAMMELGALVCTPLDPHCERCPIIKWCGARKLGYPEVYPRFVKKLHWHEVEHCATIVLVNGRILLVQRPQGQLWAGLWELPRAVRKDGETRDECALRAVMDMCGASVSGLQICSVHKHVVTNKRVTLSSFTATLIGNPQLRALACDDFAWVKPEDFVKFAISSPQRALLRQWLDSLDQPRLDLE